MNRRTVLTPVAFALIFASAAFPGQSKTAAQKEDQQKGWLGVQIQDITREMKRSMDLTSMDGALVREVVKKSPAESAGIEEKDVIVEFNGKQIEDSGDLQKAVSGTKPGTKVSVIVVRKGEKKTLEATLGTYPEVKRAFVVRPKGLSSFAVIGRVGTQGLVLSTLNEQIAQYFEAPEGKGVLVWEVKKESAAEKAGFKAGDVITMVGRKAIDEIRDVTRALEAFDEGEKVEVEVLRKGSRKTLTLEVEEENGSRCFNIWFDGPQPFPKLQQNFRIDVPHIELETIKPDMDVLRLRIDRMKDELLEQKDRLQRELRLRIRPIIESLKLREV